MEKAEQYCYKQEVKTQEEVCDDKFTTYNHTVNLYAAKQIENNTIRMEVFQKVNQLNHQTLNQYEEKKRIEESTDQTRVAEKLRPTTEEVVTQPMANRRAP